MAGVQTRERKSRAKHWGETPVRGFNSTTEVCKRDLKEGVRSREKEKRVESERLREKRLCADQLNHRLECEQIFLLWTDGDPLFLSCGRREWSGGAPGDCSLRDSAACCGDHFLWLGEVTQFCHRLLRRTYLLTHLPSRRPPGKVPGIFVHPRSLDPLQTLLPPRIPECSCRRC